MDATPSYAYDPRVSPVTASPTPFRISAVRFAPITSSTSSSSTRLLALASHHDPISTVQLRHLDTDDSPSLSPSSPSSLSDDLGHSPLSPSLSSQPLLGDVHSLVFLRPTLLAATCSTGHLHLLSTSPQTAHPSNHKPSLSLAHSLLLSPLPLTAVDVQSFSSPLVATAGLSSSLTLLDLPSLTPLRTLPHACTSSILALRFASHHSLYAATLTGTLLLFDTRSHSSHPSLTAHPSHHHAPSPLLSLSPHPARPDTVVTGSAAGTVDVWDMRGGEGRGPLSSFEVGGGWGGAVNAVSFLPFDASAVVVGSEGGGVVVVDWNVERRDPSEVDYRGEVGALELHRAGGAVRCIDVDRTSHTIVAGTDAQQLLHFQYLLS